MLRANIVGQTALWKAAFTGCLAEQEMRRSKKHETKQQHCKVQQVVADDVMPAHLRTGLSKRK